MPMIVVMIGSIWSQVALPKYKAINDRASRTIAIMSSDLRVFTILFMCNTLIIFIYGCVSILFNAVWVLSSGCISQTVVETYGRPLRVNITLLCPEGILTEVCAIT